MKAHEWLDKIKENKDLEKSVKTFKERLKAQESLKSHNLCSTCSTELSHKYTNQSMCTVTKTTINEETHCSECQVSAKTRAYSLH